MTAVRTHVDDCLTAEQVRARALEVARRRSSMRAIPVRSMRAEIRQLVPQPVEKPEIKVTVHFGYPMIPVETYKVFQFTTIQKACCKAGGVSMREMASQQRQNNIVKARMIAILLCKMLGPTDLSLPMIARRFGGRDHSTVVHTLKKLAPVRAAIERKVSSDASLHEYVSAAFDAWDELIQPRHDQLVAEARSRAAAIPRDEKGWMKK